MAEINVNGVEINDIKAVLFDKDGTFIDSNSYWGKLAQMRINELIDYYNLDKNLYEHLCTVIGYDTKNDKLIDNGPVAVLSREEVIEVMTNELLKYTNDVTTVMVSTLFYKVHSEFLTNIDDYTKLIDGALECFKLLKQNGLKLAVVTADSYEHTVKTLKLLNIDKYFDEVVGCDSCKDTKSTGIPALYALELINISPQNAIVIGDTPMDAQMAINSKCKDVILVTTGQVPTMELKEYSQHVISNLREISVSSNR